MREKGERRRTTSLQVEKKKAGDPACQRQVTYIKLITRSDYGISGRETCDNLISYSLYTTKIEVVHLFINSFRSSVRLSIVFRRRPSIARICSSSGRLFARFFILHCSCMVLHSLIILYHAIVVEHASSVMRHRHRLLLIASHRLHLHSTHFTVFFITIFALLSSFLPTRCGPRTRFMVCCLLHDC